MNQRMRLLSRSHQAKEAGRNRRRARGSGTYVLLLRLASPARLAIGKLGGFDLRSGYYCYVGSGFGSGGVLSRLAHHFRPIRHLHWHVDYLRKVALVEKAWYAVHKQKQEHRWAAILARMPDASIPLPGFGATDCSCPSHLLYFRARPTTNHLARLLRAQPLK